MGDDGKQMEAPRRTADGDPGHEGELGAADEKHESRELHETEESHEAEGLHQTNIDELHQADGQRETDGLQQPEESHQIEGLHQTNGQRETDESFRTDEREEDISLTAADEDQSQGQGLPDKREDSQTGIPYMERFYATEPDSGFPEFPIREDGAASLDRAVDITEADGEGSMEPETRQAEAAAAAEAAVFVLEPGLGREDEEPDTEVDQPDAGDEQYDAEEEEPVMDGEELSMMIEEICTSKAQEFRMLGYEYVTGSEIWECVSDKYRKQGLPALHRIVNDILSLKVTSFMNWVAMSAYKDPRIR